MGIAAESLPCYLVEWYRPGLHTEQLDSIAAHVDQSSALVRAEGLPVRRVLTLVIPTDDVVFGIFAASAADIVALVCQRAGMPASRLTAALADRNRVAKHREIPDSVSAFAS
ncbi:MAG: hypothetical protein WA317_07135 [Mycobacterium sp.]|jgi:hypothetical protein|uniref:hypothetical protein n=1 Tax=Mycobacterium sp. TaxID=1785 RepID=UPI003CC5DF0C